jgi:ligand-binding sensor domain-containing protein/class 3 adenylate cyclase
MKFFSLLLALAGAVPAWALPSDLSLGQLVVDQWNDRTGLPSNSVLDVLQDARGYIWIASYDGLVRFDGATFTVINKESGVGFTSNSARVLLSAADGTLWVGTNTEGLFAYRDGRFQAYGKEEGLPDLSIRALGYDGKGRLWAGTAGGVAVLENGRFTTSPDNVGLSTFFSPLGDGTLLMGSNKPGLWQTSGTHLVPYLPQLFSPGQALAGVPVSSAFVDRRNQLWLGSGAGRILVVSGNEVVRTIEPEALKGATVKDFLADRDGTLWVATDKGLFSDRGDDFVGYTEDNGLPNNSVTSLWQDLEGSFWVGSERGGLVKFSPGKFINVTQREGLAGNAVNAVVEDGQGTVWVGSDQGLSVLPSRGAAPAADKERQKAVDKVLADLGKTRIRQIRLDSQGVLWFATYSDQGLYAFDGRKSWTVTQKDGLPVNRVRLSLEDRRGRLWIGTSAGLVLRQNGVTTTFGRDQGLKNDFILSLFEDAAGAIWIGLDGGGAARLNPDGTLESWTTADGLAGNVVFRFFADNVGRLWIGTSDGLSLALPPSTTSGKTTFRNYHTTDGLVSDSVYQVLQEANGGPLWLVTSRGLQIVSAEALAAPGHGLDRGASRVLDRLDGLAGQPSSNAWAFQNAQGVLYVPTIGGLSIYNPQSVSRNPTPPPVLLEGLTFDDKSLAAGASAVVPAGTRRVVLSFTALSFMIPQKVGFQYRLDGYDTAWVPGGDRKAVYTNLPPGNYNFHVRAWNNDGVVNEKGASIALRVEPRFYETPWFLVLVAAALVASGFLVNVVRIRAVNRRKNELERQVTDRTEALNLEKQKTEALLLNVLPARVADELKRTGHSEPRVHGGVTVLFADLVAFTETAAHLSPAQTIHELNDLFSSFDAIAAKHGAERIKTIGDAWLAVAGLSEPEATGADQEGALKLVAVAHEILSLLAYRRTQADIAWQVRIGLHTGAVVGGVVGIEKYIYDIFGDTVNTASRMQDEAGPDSVILSATTAGLVADRWPVVSLGSHPIKGKGTLEIYTLKP